jgi:plastocyanin
MARARVNRMLVGLWVALALVAGGLAGLEQAWAATSAPAKAKAKAKAKVRCRWVKATRKRKRHKVCVKVKMKAKPKATTNPPAAKAPVTVAPAAGIGTPVSAPPTGEAAPAPTGTPPSAAGDGTATPAIPVAARLQATTREWSITLSRPSIAAGAVTLELVNRGEDAHDLHVRPAAGGADILSVARTESLGLAHAEGTLPAGSYTLYCSLPGHEAAGMRATLSVQ